MLILQILFYLRQFALNHNIFIIEWLERSFETSYLILLDFYRRIGCVLLK